MASVPFVDQVISIVSTGIVLSSKKFVLLIFI